MGEPELPLEETIEQKVASLLSVIDRRRRDLAIRRNALKGLQLSIDMDVTVIEEAKRILYKLGWTG